MKRYFDTNIDPAAKKKEFHINAIGINETMRPTIVNRPNGLGDYLLMFFYQPVVLKVNGAKEPMEVMAQDIPQRRDEQSQWPGTGKNIEKSTLKVIKEYPAQTLMLWKSDEGHYYGNTQMSWEHSWIHFIGKSVPSFLDMTNMTAGPVYFPHQALVEKYLNLLFHERVDEPTPDETIQINYFQNFLFEIMRKRKEKKKPVVPEGIQKAKHFIEHNPTKPITLSKLAKIASCSPPHFSAEFKKYFHHSPIDYLIRLKLRLACYYLRDENMTVAEIADRLGYTDAYHFSKQFKKFHGDSPSDYRKRTLLAH